MHRFVTQGRPTRPAVYFLIACCIAILGFAGAGQSTRADDSYAHPRLSLGTGDIQEWVYADSIDFLLRFQEIFGGNPSWRVNEVKDSMTVRGHSDWVANTLFLYNFMPQCVSIAGPYSGSTLPTYVYDWAKNDIVSAIAVAVHHNLYDYGVDWLLHDADGDTMCVWGTECNSALANMTPWCPRGQWNGRVVRWVGQEQRVWNFGSTVGKTYVEWLSTVALDSLFLHNDMFAEAFDGVQLEEGAKRDLACWGTYKPGHPDSSALPDPKRDSIGIDCYPAFEESTKTSFDSLMTYFVGGLRGDGYRVRVNGQHLRWAYDPNWPYDEDTLITHGAHGCKFEQYGDWVGWPYDSTGTAWFEIYDGAEDYFHPAGCSDADAGWDASVVQSRTWAYADADEREQWTRLNLGQALMGDGFFSGMATNQDEYFYEFLEGEEDYAPLIIEEMDLALGHAVAGYHKFKPRNAADSLYYRQFRTEASGQTPSKTCTVVVNMWEDEIGGVPARDAQWYKGLRSTFPQPDSLLVFDHWSKRKGEQMQTAGPHRSDESRHGLGLRQIRFALERDASVLLTIYDVEGRRVRTVLDGRRPAGAYVMGWDGVDDAGRRVGSGLYFWRVQIDGKSTTKRALVLR